MLHNVIDRAIQVHGALGVTADTPLEKMYREARADVGWNGGNGMGNACFRCTRVSLLFGVLLAMTASWLGAEVLDGGSNRLPDGEYAGTITSITYTEGIILSVVLELTGVDDDGDSDLKVGDSIHIVNLMYRDLDTWGELLEDYYKAGDFVFKLVVSKPQRNCNKIDDITVSKASRSTRR